MDKVTMTKKELKRVEVIAQLEAGVLKTREASELLGLSERQVKRLRKAYREKGAVGLAHGNRGKASPRWTEAYVREQVVELVRGQYRDYNNQHVQEILAERHGIELSVSTVRRIRLAAGIGSPRKRRAPRHRRKRERYPMEGMLLQGDGSPHEWLEGRGPRLTLVAYIDDATNEVPGAVFREQEDAAGYLLALEQVVKAKGLPVAIYADRHTIFQAPGKAGLEQELTGKQPVSQFERALQEVGVRLIPAYSPQAKGRVERLFGTLQDRLVKTLREANACTLEEANTVLATFLVDYNRKFKKEAAQPGSAYRSWPADLHPSHILCFKYTRTVRNDNTISFDGHVLSIPPGTHRRSFARCRVDVHQHLTGHLSVHYQGQQLAEFEPSGDGPVRVGQFEPAHPYFIPLPEPEPVQPATPDRQPVIPAPDHPWRRSYKLTR
jgi:transposase